MKRINPASLAGVLAALAVGCGGLASGTSGLGGNGGRDSGSPSPDSSFTDRAPMDTSTPDASTCPSGESLCGTLCVNEQTDANNCGGCGIVCSGMCTSGRCAVTLQSWPGPPQEFGPANNIRVNAASIYATRMGGYIGSSVVEIPLSGGAATTLASNQVNNPSGLALDDTSVYWTITPDDLSPPDLGGVMKMPLAGGPITTLVSGPYIANAVAVDATRVYWTNGNNNAPTGSVLSVPIGGGALTTLASGQANPAGIDGIALDAEYVYWTNVGLVTTSRTGGSVMKVPLAGGIVTTLASGLDAPSGIAVDATNAYWVTNSRVMSLPLSGGVPTTLATGGDNGNAFAIDETSVYWVSAFTCGLMKVPLGGGAVTKLWSGIDPNNSQTCLLPFAIAVDTTSVYFSTATTAWASLTLMRLTPK